MFFKVELFGELQTRLHVGLIDGDRIKNGETSEKVISEIITKLLGYKVSSIIGVKSDRKMKKVSDPFSK